MSATLEKIMQLKQMAQNAQPQMTEQQRDFAQGEMLMKLAAQMRNPNHGGSGLSRLLRVANASMDPIEESWKKARERSLKENNEAMDFAMKLHNMDIDEEKRKEDREYNKRYLSILEGRNSKKKESEDGSSPKERRILWNALGGDAKAEEYRKGMILNWSPTETQANFIKGIHPEDVAAEQGINLDEHEGSYLLTGSGRNQIKQAEGIEAEIDSLTKETGKDLKYFTGPSLPRVLGGANINETFDSLTGKNREARLKGLGARALQAEIAGARARFAGASSAQEAIHGMQEDALARVEIFEQNISGEDRAYVQNYMNEKLSKAFKARKRAVMGLNKEEKKENKGSFFKSGPSGSKGTQSQSKTVRGIWKEDGIETEVEIPIEKANQFELDGGVLIGY